MELGTGQTGGVSLSIFGNGGFDSSPGIGYWNKILFFIIIRIL
jgi:hypothetical protein